MTNTPKNPEALSRNTIAPAEYAYEFSYGFVTVDGPLGPIRESFEVDEALAILENESVQGKWNREIFKCALCGANFCRGDVFRHEPTGAYMFLGWQCANLFFDVSAFLRKTAKRKLEAARKIAFGKAAAMKRRAEAAACVEALAADFPTLADDLQVEHYITSDIRSRLEKWGKISAKQAALVVKIANEARNPKPEEKHCPAPEGRVEFTGVIVSCKLQRNDFGEREVITVKVTEDDATWLAWFTLPSKLARLDSELKGETHTFRVTLKRSDRDDHFAFGKRPTWLGSAS